MRAAQCVLYDARQQMKFAKRDNQRVEATFKAEAECPMCGSPVIPKCGLEKVHHWAHKNLKECDRWAEGETEWHRAWKDKFPAEWQERVQNDPESGERHRADVRTPSGLVVEIQRSHLDPNERVAREKFYRSMVWVVDGTRLKRDFRRFHKIQYFFRTTGLPGFSFCRFPEEYFPSAWVESSAPVCFDFVGMNPVDAAEWGREPIWCLLPGRAEGNAVVAALEREKFVDWASKNPYFFLDPAPTLMTEFSKLLLQRATQGASLRVNSRPLGRW